MKLVFYNGAKIGTVVMDEVLMTNEKEIILRSGYLTMLRTFICFPNPKREGKFVVVCERHEHGDYFVCFFLNNIPHLTMAKRLGRCGLKFIGAGIWSFNREETERIIEISDFKVQFSSYLCKKEYGFDGSEERENRGGILPKIAEVLKKLFIVINERVEAEKKELGI